MKKYEQIDHTGDIGIKVFGKTLEELYENSAFAYYDIICNLNKVETKEKKILRVSGEDPKGLLRELVQELLCLTQIDFFLACQFQCLEYQPFSLTLELWGELIQEEKHEIYIEIKGITYHKLEVQQNAQGLWEGFLILDV